jgi:SAM-dependent methyltransferase
MKKHNIKDQVKSKYSRIGYQSKKQNQSSCCGSTGCCQSDDYTVFSDDYSHLHGYLPDADLGLGCGLPTEFAGIKPGDTVIDLGSGAGNDCFIARSETGESGKVTGIDFTAAMIRKAKENAQKLNYTNVEFIEGDIENLPVDSESCDVVISNCVLNLVPDKKKAFSEILRVLKNRGHFCISDVVLQGELHDKIKNDMVMYAGCISGALQKQDYLQIIRDCGFENIMIKKEKPIVIPDAILLKYLNGDEIIEMKQKNGIYSITVVAEKSSGIINNYNYNPEDDS